MERDRVRSAVWRALPLLVLLAAAVAGWVMFGDRLTLAALRENEALLRAGVAAHPVFARAAYMGLYVVVVALSLPGGLVMTLAGGFLFGTLQGGVMVAVSATTGAAILFLVARSSLGAALEARVRAQAGLLSRLSEGVRENAVSVLLLMRLVPAVPFWLANLAPAFLGVPFRTYLWTTFLGILPATFVFCAIGAGLGAVFARGEEPTLSLLTEPRFLLPLIGLCGLAALPMLLKRRGA